MNVDGMAVLDVTATGASISWARSPRPRTSGLLAALDERGGHDLVGLVNPAGTNHPGALPRGRSPFRSRPTRRAAAARSLSVRVADWRESRLSRAIHRPPPHTIVDSGSTAVVRCRIQLSQRCFPEGPERARCAPSTPPADPTTARPQAMVPPTSTALPDSAIVAAPASQGFRPTGPGRTRTGLARSPGPDHLGHQAVPPVRRWPPSSNGMGKRLMRPIETDMNPINPTRP